MEYSSHPSQSSGGIHDKVAQIYYRHGLFCSSHPYAVILVTLGILTICCYPILHLPFLGSSSQQFTTSIPQYSALLSEPDNMQNNTVKGPRWFQGPPVAFVQQIVIRSAISPWQSSLVTKEALRAPLAEAFNLIEMINNHQIVAGDEKSTVLSDLCFQVFEPVDKKSAPVLPHYNCLTLSPTHIWKELNRFCSDSDILKTIFQLQGIPGDVSSLGEIIFGIPWKETGIKKLYITAKPRVITYAITLIFKTFDQTFMRSLQQHLQHKYPYNPFPENNSNSEDQEIIHHVYFHNQRAVAEFVPLGATYIILFLYIYFSVRKIELVKSKWALAVSAVMTVVMSLLMSVGLCLWFGLNPTLNGSEILPYLVVIIGLENMLVLTKSVVSTPDHLDVKLRVAQGLSKEGWSITKNLFTELAVLTFAFFTFVPAIQEFCLFAVVGLLSDFFLQLVFFATFLSIDIRRKELADLHKDTLQQTVSIRALHQQVSIANTQPSSIRTNTYSGMTLNRPNSSLYNNTHYSARVFASPTTPMLKLPKRLRFVYFWARTRMVQRGLMVCLVVWVVLFVYKSGLVERLTDNSTNLAPSIAEQVVRPILMTFSRGNATAKDADVHDNHHWKGSEHAGDGQTGAVKVRLKHRNLNMWKSLSHQHWSALFGYYNISLSGRYISILPSLPLSVPIDPRDAELLCRTEHISPPDKASKFQSLDDAEETDVVDEDSGYYPSSPSEAALAIALSIPSFLFFIYLMVVLYRCMCSRHYAEWRSSWSRQHSRGKICGNDNSPDVNSDAYLIMETLPVKLHGHIQELENIVTESSVIVSSCLAGDVCVWDAISGECVSVIRRSRSLPIKMEHHNSHRGSGSFSSDSTYGSSPSDNIDYMNNYNCSSHLHSSHKSTSVISRHSTPISSSDLTTHLPSESLLSSSPSLGYDFSRFYSVAENQIDDRTKNSDSANHIDYNGDVQENQMKRDVNEGDVEMNSNTCIHYSPLSFQPIWCIDYKDNWIAIGCRGGRLEVWEASSGNLKYVYEESKSGVTALCIFGNRLVISRINGVLEFFLLEMPCDSLRENHIISRIDCSSAKETYPLILPSMDSLLDENFQCVFLNSIRAHNQPVTALVVGGGHVITGSQDHLVKVFHSDSGMCIFTLHGHSGSISVLHIDQITPTSAASGCQNGVVCVWDLLTGTCVYSMTAHHGAITILKSTNMYLISQGTDRNIRIWEKYQGHLLHSLRRDDCACTSLLLLTSNIMITAEEDHLTLWDVNHGEQLRVIMLGSGEKGARIKQLKLAGQAVVCDYGCQMFVIHFPALSEKTE